MRSRERKERLLENIARLRRADRALPGNRDIALVRAALEQELGETISRRLAARFLGVSHAALARWTRAGDLPLVHGTNGRLEIPVAAVLDLHEAVAREREAGRRRRHLLEPIMAEGRERAAQLRPQDLVAPTSSDDDAYDRAERRSLAYHRALAHRLRRPMVDEARHLVSKWRDQGKLDPRYADQWEEVLRRPVAEIRRVIAADTPAARDLRQNSPFAGMLSEPERRKILREVR